MVIYENMGVKNVITESSSPRKMSIYSNLVKRIELIYTINARGESGNVPNGDV
jgi:hypothetical protein